MLGIVKVYTYMTLARTFLLLSILILSGCVPDELSEAGKCFYRENYGGTIRKINLFLEKQQSDTVDEQSKFYQAIAFFYRGISKRACEILRIEYRKNDCLKSESLRLRNLLTYDFSTKSIISDYSKAKRLKADLVCTDFHIGLEYILCGEFEKAATFLSEFQKAICLDSIPNIERQFDGEYIFHESRKLADCLLREIAIGHTKTIDIDLSRQVLSFYRDTLFRKSKHHELYNIQLLSENYPVSRFKFLLQSINLESDYDYFSKNIECGPDYIILRSDISGDFDILTKKLIGNGFSEWKRCENLKGMKVVSKLGVCVFEGDDDMPILVCGKKISFARVLLAIYSLERRCLYCIICKEGAPLVQCVMSRMGL